MELQRRGVGLAQLAVALGVLAVLLAAVGPLATGRLDSAQAARTVREARGIADAALAYWEAHPRLARGRAGSGRRGRPAAGGGGGEPVLRQNRARLARRTSVLS